MACQSCQPVRIQGVLCHETGCPDAWKDEIRECLWCGSDFEPEERNQKFCEESCLQDYFGFPSDEAEKDPEFFDNGE